MRYSIYKITNLVNNKCYIGYTENPKKRWKQHRVSRKDGKKPLYQAFRKYGIENFTFEILYESEDRNETLLIKEPYYIQLHDSIRNGYNLQEGGNNTNTDEMKEKSRNRMLQNNPMKNPEIAKKVSEKLKGVTRHFSKERNEKISSSKLGNKNPMYGNTHAADHLNESKHVCEHCQITTTIGNYVRWHGNKCKRRI